VLVKAGVTRVASRAASAAGNSVMTRSGWQRWRRGVTDFGWQITVTDAAFLAAGDADQSIEQAVAGLQPAGRRRTEQGAGDDTQRAVVDIEREVAAFAIDQAVA
jgi:hypothetical protein